MKIRYKIKAGNNYSSNWIVKFFKFFNSRKTISKKVFFTKECFAPREQVSSSGKNKIFGFAGLNNHKYSARWVWQSSTVEGEENLINLFAYTYVNSERVVSELLYQIKTGLWSEKLSIKAGRQGYHYSIGDEEVYFIESDKTKHCRSQFPYHGGNDAAYNEMVIILK